MKTLHTIYTSFAKRLVMSLMVLMTIGVGTVFADTYTWTLASGDLGGQTSPASSVKKGSPAITWNTTYTWGTSSKYLGWDGSNTKKGVQIGSGSAYCTKAVFSTSDISGTITNVTVNGSHASSGGASIVIKVGGETVKNSTNFTTSAADYSTGTISKSGQIEITISNSKEKAFYLKSISITYTPAPSGYAVTWDKNGRGDVSDVSKFPTTASSLTLQSLSATGYTNTGWTANVDVKNGSNTIEAGDLINNATTVTLSQATTFTAQWSAKTYTITLNNQSANIAGTTSITATYNSNENLINKITIPQKNYHNFGGYYTQTNGNGTQLIDSEGNINANAGSYTDANKLWKYDGGVTLYAKWIEKDLTNYRTSCTTETIVTLDPNGGTISNTDGWTENGNGTYSKTHDGTEIALPTATKTNYIFDGWYNGETKYESIPSDLVESITLTAKWLEKQDARIYWDPESVTVTIDADGNILPEFNNPNEIDGIEFSSSNPSVVAVDANGVITLGSTGTTATVTITATFDGDATYAAKEATCTLTVNPSNCRWVEVTDNATLENDDEVVITMTKDNYVWTISNEKNTSAAPKANDITANIQGNYLTTVSDEYKWVIKKDNANLTFYSYSNNANYLYCINGDDGVRVGTGTAKVFVVDGNYLKNTQTTDPRYVGISFNTDPYSWRCYTGTTGVIKSQTLKLYKKVCLDSENYWVTWDAGEGAWEDKSSKKIESYQVGATITKPAESPTREGYRFDGWSPEPTIMPAQNTTFTAKWTEVYKVTWYENGVPSYTYVPSDNAVVTWEDNIADCGEKKFYGWTADDTFVSDPTTPPTLISKGTTIAGDVTYYAVYADAEEPANPGYAKVTTISEGIYLIATGETSSNKAYTGKYPDKTYGGTCDVTVNNQVISTKPTSAVEVEVTLGTGANSGKFAIYDGTYYLSAPDDNALTFNGNIVYDWKLTAEGHINSTGQSARYIQLNSSASPNRFACYSSNQKKAYLYKKQTTSYENFAVSCDKYTITVAPDNGTVTTTPADEAGQGQTITVNITPADCKYLTALKYNDGSDYSINIASAPYTFTMPAADVTVTATFADKNATDIEILTSAHRMLMQGSAFVGEQVRITYNNGDKETLNWNDSRLTFTGHNTATLGSQTVIVTYNGCGTQSASYAIEVIDGLGITFWDDDYTETIKYEPGDLVDVDNKIGQNICSGWEFVGWSETKVANKSNGFTPVHNFNATDAKVLYAVYVQTSTDWISAYNIDELHPGAKYVIVAHYDNSKEYALTNTNNTNSSYLDGANLTTDCEQVREGDAYPYKDRYKLKVTPDENWKWQLENTGSGWTMRNISANKYLKINTDKTISLTATADDKFTLSNGDNDSEITAQSNSNNYLSWYNSSRYWNGHTSGQQYYLTNETNFTSTPPCSPLSATFYGNGGIVTDGKEKKDYLPIKEPTRDAGITTPTASFADCNGKSWTFVGWAREEIDVTRVPVLTTDLLHDGGGNKHYYIQEDGEEFWAVYTNQGTPETKYGTITFTDDDVTTQYENAKTITKSVTAMGDYDFELYHVSNASSLGIQFDHNNATRGYIKNITSLGKINSISLNNFQTGDIDDVKVYVGNMPNAINTLLTEADLQQIGNTYTYYPPKNYAYVKIEANGYCGITSISIDFGKGTQIWATTPDCSTIILSGDELYVTSTNGQSIRAAERLTVKAVQLESKAKVVISSNSSDIYFSDVQDANFTQAVKPTETLTLPTDVDGNLSATEIYVHYRPSVDGTGIPEDVVVSANLETPNPSITDDHTIHVRNLPADFVIAAKWGDNWYAMPANMDSQSSTEGWLIEVDDAANPTKALAAPNTTKYGLKSVYTSNSTDDRFENYGERLVFVENVTEATPVANKTLYNGGGSGTSNTNIQVYAQYTNYYNENPDRYEWIPTTTDMIDYTLTSAHQFTKDAGTLENARTVSLDNHGIFGTLLQDKSYNGMVRLLPVDNFYSPAELQVVEWKANGLSIMYTGVGTKYTTKVGDNAESSVQALSRIDHAVYCLATTDLTAATNQPLVITIKDDDDATISAIKLTIPAIVAADKATTELGVAEANAKATSIVVLDGATLTASTTKYTYDDVVVYPGGKLVIGKSGKLGMYTLTLRLGSSWGAAEYEYKYPQFVLNTTTDDAYSNTSGQINLDYVTTKDQYYTFVAPFEVKTKDIKYPIDIYGTNVATNNSGSFEFEYYDGAARAAGNTGWTTVEEDPEDGADLEAGKGYTFLGMPKKVSVNGATSTRQKYGIHRIPMKVAASKAQEHENNDQTVPLAVTLAEKDNDSGWNIVGNPYMSNVMGLTNNDIQVGELVQTDDANGNWTGKWHWDNPTTGQRFLVIPSNDGRSYTSVQVSNATLQAFKHFFVQIHNKDANAMSIPVANRVEVDRNLAPARYAQAEIEKDIEIAVQMTGDKLNDQMDFLINDIYSTAFEKNADFTKMMNATNFNIYGVHVDNNLSFVALDKAAAMQSVAIGFQVPKAGDYQLRLSDKPYVMTDKIEALFVTDHEASPEVTTNLVDEDYTFYVNQAQTNNTRFTVSIILKPEKENTPTGVDNINTKANQPIKFFYQDKIYILRNGMIYDTTGKQVITINK